MGTSCFPIIFFTINNRNRDRDRRPLSGLTLYPQSVFRSKQLFQTCIYV